MNLIINAVVIQFNGTMYTMCLYSKLLIFQKWQKSGLVEKGIEMFLILAEMGKV